MKNIKKMDFQREYSLKQIPSTNYLTHGIHAYTAKLIPHIPHHFIKKYSNENDIIFDPFCGSGTSLLEAKLLGRNGIGMDINPLATLISQVKTTPFNVEELSHAILLIKERLKNDNGKSFVEFPNINYWFCDEAQNDLSKIKYIIENLNGEINEDIYKFFLVCFSSIIRKSSYADRRMAKVYKSKRVVDKISNGWTPTPIKYFIKKVDKNFELIKLLSEKLNNNGNNNNTNFLFFHGDVKETSTILNKYGIKEVDFIITSPPYINAQDYFRSYKFEIWWLDLASPDDVRYLKKQVIGTENISGNDFDYSIICENDLLNKIIKKIILQNKTKAYIILNYFINMDGIFKEFYNLLKEDGYFCLITGNNTICEVQIPTYKILINLAENNGFKLSEICKDQIKNRLLPPGRNHNGGIIKEEWITVFKKEGK